MTGPHRIETVELRDAALWTRTSGVGPPLVLAHGGPGMSDNLGLLARMVDDLVTVHRYDQRACGRSTGLAAGQTVETAVHDLDALRRHWGHDSWIVGGHSWGAALALFYALRHPRRTRAVVYLSGPGVSARADRPRARPRRERLSDGEREQFDELLRTAGTGQDPAAQERLAHLLWRTSFSDPARAPDFAAAPLFDYPCNTAAAEELSRSATQRLRAGLAEEAATLDVPVLIVHGEDDPLPVEGALDLADRLPNAELAVLPGVGHLPWLEDEGALAAPLRAFLHELVPGEARGDGAPSTATDPPAGTTARPAQPSRDR